MKIFYMVRKVGTNLFYNPNKPGDRKNPTFDKKGKRYYGLKGLTNAEKAVKFCASEVNDHWFQIPPIKKDSIKTEIVTFEERVIELPM